MKIIVAIVALKAVFVGGVVSDYCLVSQDRCDKDGIYKYKWITSYQDFIIRDKLDSELENIKKDPWLALKRSQQTLETNPNRWVPLYSFEIKYGLHKNTYLIFPSPQCQKGKLYSLFMVSSCLPTLSYGSSKKEVIETLGMYPKLQNMIA